MASNAEIRFRARNTLGIGLFSNGWIYAVMVAFLMELIITITTSAIIGLLIIGIVGIGGANYYLGRARRYSRHDDLNSLLYGIKGDLAGNVVIGLLTTLYTFLWALLFIIPGIVKAYSYSMVYYIKIDHPEYTASQAIDESKILMDGKKWKLFLLDLSFIGWFRLGALCLGIGTLWATAYLETAHAEFYRDIIGESN